VSHVAYQRKIEKKINLLTMSTNSRLATNLICLSECMTLIDIYQRLIIIEVLRSFKEMCSIETIIITKRKEIELVRNDG